MTWVMENSQFPDQEYYDVPYSAEKVAERISYQCQQRDLDLSLCNLASVPLEAIRKYHGGPIAIDLSHNWIAEISPKFTLEMAHLSRLDLSKNRITKLPSDFGRLRKLTYLDLHCNLLESLPVSMAKLFQLHYLNISENPLRPPLSKFLEMEAIRKKQESYKVDGIHPVVTFLAHFSQKVQVDAYAYGDAVDRGLVRRKRSVTFDSRFVDQSSERLYGGFSESDVDAGNMKRSAATGHPRQRRRRTSHSARDRVNHASYVSYVPMRVEQAPAPVRVSPIEKPSRGIEMLKGTACFAVLLLLTPILVALMVDPTYFDELAQCSYSDCEGEGFWKFYHSVHHYATAITRSYCNLNVPLSTQAPPLPLPDSGLVIAVVRSIYRFVSSVFRGLAFWK